MGLETRAPFGERLHAAISRLGPLCVGIDPATRTLADWGLPDTATGTREFAARMVDAAAGQVAIVKPQSAFFERHGSAGVRVLEELCGLARDAGLLMLLDAKRGDIGSTNEGYAQAYLRPDSPIPADALTATAYTGFAALRPLVDTALANGTGVFVLVRTSNPEGIALQTADTREAGLDVAGTLLRDIAAANADAGVLGSIGCVFGATMETGDYRLAHTRGPILAPGLGAQGAAPADIARRFASCAGQVLPTASRSLSAAGPDGPALRRAVADLAARCAEALTDN
jgi:orotidine-5'-phosphate decarboxylase